MSVNPFNSTDKKILADSGTSGEAAKNLYHLTDRIGPRFAGTDAYREAAYYMLSVFKRYRLDSFELEPFEFTAWKRGKPGSLTMTSPVMREYPCYALPYSLTTSEKGVTAGVVDIGKGSEAEIEAKRKAIKGKLVMTNSAATHRSVICKRCAELGAVGFLLIGQEPGMILPTGSISFSGEEGTLPAAGIGMECGLEIMRLAEAEAEEPVLTLTTETSFEPSVTMNVVGEIRGSEYPDELVLMGGHLDSHENGPGALDNAAGAVQVMEAARLLAKQKKRLKRTVRFIGFAAEEVGLLGSHYHAEKHKKALKKARFMLNSDCPALGNPKGLAFHQCPKGEAYLETLSKEIATPISYQTRMHCHSDHWPFILQGLPTAGMGCGDFTYSVRSFYHTPGDTADKISVTDLRAGAAFAAQILLRAASDEAWPKMRRSKAEVKHLKDTVH